MGVQSFQKAPPSHREVIWSSRVKDKSVVNTAGAATQPCRDPEPCILVMPVCYPTSQPLSQQLKILPQSKDGKHAEPREVWGLV